MENTNLAPESTQGSVAASQAKPLWEVLGENMDVIVKDPPKQEATDLNKDNAAGQETILNTEEKKEETQATEKKEETPTEVKKEEKAPETEAKTENKAEEEPKEEKAELTLEDVKDAPKTYTKGSYQDLAQDLFNLQIEKEDYADLQKAFKENFVPKAELEAKEAEIKENYFASFENPEVAAALKLKEMGLPDHLLLDPTAEIDSLTKLEDVELIRKEYEARAGYDTEMVDAAIEQDIADNKVGVKAKMVRAQLEANKTALLNQRSQLVDKYTQERQQAIIRQKEQETNQIKEALTNASDFMGVPIAKDAINGIIHKLNKGLYENELKNPANIATLILHKEFGERIAKLKHDKARAEGKAEATAKLSNIPIQTAAGGGVVNNKTAKLETEGSVFGNLPADFSL